MRVRPKKKTVVTVDLFCGAGGESTGMGIAVKRCGLKQIGIVVNHWDRAVQTMKMNHPNITTYEMDIMTAIPAELVPGGVVDLLHASPSCTHHSRAKGGRPCSNQLRSQPDVILRCTSISASRLQDNIASSNLASCSSRRLRPRRK